MYVHFSTIINHAILNNSSALLCPIIIDAVLCIVVAIHRIRQFSNERAKAMSLLSVGGPLIQFEVS